MREEKQQYAEWLCIPRKVREEIKYDKTHEEHDPDFPITQQEYSARYKISQKTLSFWKKDADVERFRKKYRKKLVRRTYYDEMIQSQVDKALDGDTAAFKEVTTFLGDRVEKSQIGISFDDLSVLFRDILEAINKTVSNPTEVNALLDLIQVLVERFEDEE